MSDAPASSTGPSDWREKARRVINNLRCWTTVAGWAAAKLDIGTIADALQAAYAEGQQTREATAQERDQANKDRAQALEIANTANTELQTLRRDYIKLQAALLDIIQQSTAWHTTKTHLAAIAGEALGRPIYSNQPMSPTTTS